MRAENATSTVDGNVLAGLLAGVIDDDATTLVGVCAGCGSEGPLAETVVEIDEVAAIVRCRSCTHTLLTVLQDGERVRVVIGMLRELRRG
jgi:DNA-directed RNA polymerase subunit RPC12/RpoP